MKSENKKGKTLALDLGVNSIGYVLMEEVDGTIKFLNQGVFIPNNDPKQLSKYNSGSNKYETSNAIRRNYRSIRNNSKNYKKRRKLLKEKFSELFQFKEYSYSNLPQLKLKALEEKINESELYAILRNYNKYRGYNELDDISIEENSSEYKKSLNVVSKWCEENDKTITSYYLETKSNIHSNDKYPVLQELYKQELKLILENQSKHYSELDKKTINSLMKIIYFRNPLPSVRRLKNNCKYEHNKKVTPISNPIFQEFKIWSTIHNITIKNIRDKKEIEIPFERKKDLFEELNSKKELNYKQILKILLEDNSNNVIENYRINYKKIEGNVTRCSISKVDDNLDIYQTWNEIYSEPNSLLVKRKLKKKHDEDISEKLSKITLKRNNCKYSQKAIKNILPYMNGKKDKLNLYDSIREAYPPKDKYINYKSKIEKIKHNSLKNPIVEKQINHTIDIINYNLKNYDIDTITIEMAREMKKSKKARQRIFKLNSNNEKKKNLIKKFLENNGKKTNIKNIKRIQLWLEQGGEIENNEAKSDSICLYSGEKINIDQALNSNITQIDHIIPKSKEFSDNNNSNLTLCYSEENSKKSSSTGFDYMNNKTKKELDTYKKNVENLYSNNELKRNTFLVGESEYGLDSNERFGRSNLNDTSYITKELKNHIKRSIDVDVITTNGMLTSFFRNNIKSYFNGCDNSSINDIIYKLSLLDKREKFNKRIDHRHHCLDACLISLIKRSYIRDLNTLSSNNSNGKNVRKEILNDVMSRFCGESPIECIYGVIKKCIVARQNPKKSKYNKKINTNNKYSKSTVYRGSLHEETIYGFKNDYYTKKISVEGFLNEKSKKQEKIISKIIDEDIVRRIKSYSTVEEAFKKDDRLSIIKKFKVREKKTESYFNIKGKKYAKSGNIHHIKFKWNNKKDKLNYEVVDFLEYSKKDQLKYSGYDFTLRKGEHLLISNEIKDNIKDNIEDYINDIFRISQLDRNSTIHLRYIYDSEIKNDTKFYKKSINSLIKDHKYIYKIRFDKFGNIKYVFDLKKLDIA